MPCITPSVLVMEIILSLGILFLSCACIALEENVHQALFSGLALKRLILIISPRGRQYYYPILQIRPVTCCITL